MVNRYPEVCPFLINKKGPSYLGEQEIAFTHVKRISTSFVLVENVTKTIPRYWLFSPVRLKKKKIKIAILIRI